jgi:hypothetical protein
VLTLVLATLFTACGGGNSIATSTASSSAATGVATTASGAATAGATTASSSKTSDICAKIPLADAQALTPQTLKPAADAAGIPSCLFHNAGKDVKVDYYLSDADQHFYKSLSNSSDHQLSGVGDEAFWNEPIDGHSPPYLSAHKGNVTCTIVSNDPPDTTMKFTGPPTTPLYTVTADDALAYAQLMGKVCNDVFAAQ